VGRIIAKFLLSEAMNAYLASTHKLTPLQIVAAVVAESLGARAVFYDPTMKIIDNCPTESNISLLQGRYALERELSSHIKKARHAGTSA